jgi:hypothetical protein
VATQQAPPFQWSSISDEDKAAFFEMLDEVRVWPAAQVERRGEASRKTWRRRGRHQLLSMLLACL